MMDKVVTMLKWERTKGIILRVNSSDMKIFNMEIMCIFNPKCPRIKVQDGFGIF